MYGDQGSRHLMKIQLFSQRKVMEVREGNSGFKSLHALSSAYESIHYIRTVCVFPGNLHAHSRNSWHIDELKVH